MVLETVVFLIRSLDLGGAERQVIELASGLHRRGIKVVVITFYDGGALAGDLVSAGVSRISLAKRGRWDLVGFAFRLVSTLRELRPTVLYSFLTTANILATMSKPWLRGAHVIWGLRASNLDLSNYDAVSRTAQHLEAKLAWFADLVIANSEAGRRDALSLGFPARSVVVVHNGIDTERFRHDAEGRRRVRAEWGVADRERLVGLVARLDPMKDHANFLQAASAVSAKFSGVRFVCVGDGPPERFRSLQSLADEIGLAGRVIWTGGRKDMPAVFSALDVACSASAYGEGFSNAIAEAMATGIPCAATDVGDSAIVVGDAGRIVPPRDPTALADAILQILSLDAVALESMRHRARRRMVDFFSVDSMVGWTLNCFSRVLGES